MQPNAPNTYLSSKITTMRYLYLTLIALFLGFSAQSQSLLHFTTTQYSAVSDTIGNSITLSDSIYNSSHDTIVPGPIYLYSRIGSTIYTDSTAPFIDTPVISVAQVDTGGSPFVSTVGFSITIHFTQPYFEVGPPIGIVIWPVYNDGQAGPNDSLRLSVQLYYPLGISESPLSRAYVYQIGDRLDINFGDAENLVQQVRIYDVEGRMMYSGSAQASQSIPANGWQRGVYFCELTTYAGERKTFKVIAGE